MNVAGEFIKKVPVTQENINSIKAQSSFSYDFKVGENAYAVKYYFVGPYNSINTYLSRNTVLEIFRDNKVILGLKIDSIGRIIEDNTNTKEYQNSITRLRNMIRKEMQSGYFMYTFDPYDYNGPDSESTKEIKKLASKLANSNDEYDECSYIENVVQDIGKTEKVYTGRVYSGEAYTYYASFSDMKLINILASALKSCSYICNKDYIQQRFEPNGWDDKAELWMESGTFNDNDIKSITQTLKEMKYHCIDSVGNTYGVGVSYDDGIENLLDYLEERYFDDIDILMHNTERNIKALIEMGFKANDPRKVLGESIKEAKKGNPVSSQTPEDYFALLIAIMTLYYKNDDIVKCLDADCIEVEKLGITIRVEPYKVNIIAKA